MSINASLYAGHATSAASDISNTVFNLINRLGIGVHLPLECIRGAIYAANTGLEIASLARTAQGGGAWTDISGVNYETLARADISITVVEI